MAKKLEVINLTAKQLLTLVKGNEVSIGGQPIKVVNLDENLLILEEIRDEIEDLIVELEDEDIDEEDLEDDEDLEDEEDEDLEELEDDED